MADVDLQGADAQRIRSRYRTSLLRDASDDEVTGWLSGSYGGGGINDWDNQIASSDEARQRGTYGGGGGGATDNTTNTGQTGQNTTNDTPPATNNQSTQPPSGWSSNDWYGAVGSIRSAYEAYLGRKASDQEVQNWLTGAYGYGNTAGAVSSMLNAIRNSGEAKARATSNPPNTTNTNNEYQDIAWWQQRGVSTSDIFDTNGQLRPGWTRTARGYERAGSGTGTGTGWDADPKGNFQNWFLQNVGSLAPSGKALEALAPQLAKYGIKLGPRNAGGMIDTIITPDGRVWDVIESATLDGGKRWQWIPAGGSGSTTGGSTTGGQGLGGQLPGTQYNDPYTKFMEQLMQSRIGQLQQPLFDPNRAMYEDALKQRANALGAAEPAYTQLLDYLQKRFTDLQGPGYTGAENEVLRTGALDPLEADRAAAKARVRDQMARRNISPDSGVFIDAMLQVDKAFDGMRGTTQTQLTTNDLARREERQQRAEGLGAQLVDIPQMRQREQLDVFQALELLSAAARSEDEARAREAITYSGALADLGPKRLQLALQAAGMGGSPDSMLNSLVNVANMNNNAAMLNRANSSNLWSGLGSIAAILARSGR